MSQDSKNASAITNANSHLGEQAAAQAASLSAAAQAQQDAIAAHCRLESWRSLLPWLAGVHADTSLGPAAVVAWLQSAPAACHGAAQAALRSLSSQPWRVLRTAQDGRLTLTVRTGPQSAPSLWRIHLQSFDRSQVRWVEQLDAAEVEADLAASTEQPLAEATP